MFLKESSFFVFIFISSASYVAWNIYNEILNVTSSLRLVSSARFLVHTEEMRRTLFNVLYNHWFS